jgi:hypothetical protein
MESDQVSSRKNRPGGQAHGDGRRHKRGGRESERVGEDQSRRGAGTMGAVAERASEYWERGESQLRDWTEGHETTTVLVALATGFGIGAMIGYALSAPHRPKSLKDRLMAEGIGRRVMDRIEGMLPEAVAGYFGK